MKIKYFVLTYCFFIILNCFAEQDCPFHAEETENLLEKKILVKKNKITPPTQWSLQKFCSENIGKIVVNVDSAYYVSKKESSDQKCELRELKEADLFNEMLRKLNSSCSSSENSKYCPKFKSKETEKSFLVSLDNCIFSKIPLGIDYTYRNFIKDFQLDTKDKNICKKNIGKIITSNDLDFYLITHEKQDKSTKQHCLNTNFIEEILKSKEQTCYKRKFKNYSDVDLLNHKNGYMLSLSKIKIEMIPDGSPLPKICDEFKITKIKSELFLQNESLEKKTALCKKINNSIVSFYNSFFYVEKCALRNIQDFNISLQIKLTNDEKSVTELTAEQRINLNAGKDMTGSEVEKKLKLF